MRTSKIALLLALIQVSTVVVLADESRKFETGPANTVRAKVAPVGPIEVELEPLRREAPTNSHDLSTDSSSQIGVQLKLRRRAKAKHRVQPVTKHAVD